MRITLRTLNALVLSVPLVLLGANHASAAPGDSSSESQGQKKVAVGSFTGPKNEQVRDWVVGVLKDSNYDVVDADIGGGKSDADYQGVAKELGVDAVVTGKVSKNFNLTITVHNAEDGTNLGDLDVKGGSAPKLKKAVEKDLGTSIADPLSMAKAAEAEPEAAPEEDAGEESEAPAEEEAPAEDAPSDDSPGKPSPLELSVGLRAYNRNFDYTDSLSEVLPGRGIDPLYSYELPLGPAIFADLRFYPMAFGGDGVLAHIGLQGHFEQGFATRSIYAENTPEELELETSMQEFRIGLRGRIPLGVHELGIFAEYGKHKFTLSGDETNPLVPDVDYGFIRPGIDGRFRFGELLLGFHVAPRILLSMGELDLEGVWFPGATGSGLDAGVEVGYSIMPSLDVIAGFDWLRYGFDFNAIPDDNPVVAGGATDTYLSGHLGILYRLGK
jgi:hypothetical protein